MNYFDKNGKYRGLKENKDRYFFDAVNNLLEVLTENNDHSAAAVVESMLLTRKPEKTKELFDRWYKRETQGYL